VGEKAREGRTAEGSVGDSDEMARNLERVAVDRQSVNVYFRAHKNLIDHSRVALDRIPALISLIFPSTTSSRFATSIPSSSTTTIPLRT